MNFDSIAFCWIRKILIAPHSHKSSMSIWTTQNALTALNDFHLFDLQKWIFARRVCLVFSSDSIILDERHFFSCEHSQHYCVDCTRKWKWMQRNLHAVVCHFFFEPKAMTMSTVESSWAGQNNFRRHLTKNVYKVYFQRMEQVPLKFLLIFSPKSMFHWNIRKKRKSSKINEGVAMPPCIFHERSKIAFGKCLLTWIKLSLSLTFCRFSSVGCEKRMQKQ